MSNKVSITQFKEPRHGIAEAVGFAGEVVVPGYVAMEALMDAKESKQMGCTFGRSVGVFALPKQRVDIVGAAQDGVLAYIKGLYCGFKMEEPSCELEVAIRDGACSVGVSNKLRFDILLPFVAP